MPIDIRITSPQQADTVDGDYFVVAGEVDISGVKRKGGYVEVSLLDRTGLISVMAVAVTGSKWEVDFAVPLEYHLVTIVASLFFENDEFPSAATTIDHIIIKQLGGLKSPPTPEYTGPDVLWADSSSSSSSSSSCSSIDCEIEVTLTGTCAFEFTDDIVYSIGTQAVDYTAIDPCECIDEVKINGLTPPVTILDGDTIDITITLVEECVEVDTVGPLCVPAAVMVRTMNGRRKTFLRLRTVGQQTLIQRRLRDRQTSSRSAATRVVGSSTGSRGRN